MIHDTVLWLTVLLMGGVGAVFAYVAVNAAGTGVDYPPLQARAYSIRSKFFWILVFAGVLIAITTTADLPYGANAADGGAGTAVEIDIEGRQWYWQMSGKEAKAGDTVVFHVSAADVNHGLGVYDPQLRLIGQTQAMPGYVNSLQLTLNEPGNYKLMCMEYCGLAHHAMVSEFTVTP